MRRLVGVSVLFVLASAFHTAGAGTADTEHLPDLKTLPPSDLRLVVGGGQRDLAFVSLAWNGADDGGPLHLVPQNTRKRKITDAYQSIFSHDAAGSWYVVRTFWVGQFTFHRAHNHWHFTDFYEHRLHLDAGGAIGDPLDRSSRKNTFCIAETHLIDATLSHARTSRTYPASNCGANNVQGLWVGWGDKYTNTLAGQSVRVTGLPDGIYWLVSTVDPEGRLTELDRVNNWAATRLQLTGNSVTVLGTATP